MSFHEARPIAEPLAHAFGQRYGLPIPAALFAIGGAAVVALSFLLVFRRAVEPALPGPLPDPVPRRPYALAWGSLAVLVLVLLVITGITGSQEIPENIVPTTFWVEVWIAVPLLVGVIGDWTRRVNPFAALARLGDSPRLRKAVLARTAPLSWPSWLAWWPSVALFTLLVVGELVYNATTTKPAFIGVALAVYAVANVFLGLLFGPAWEERGEVFSVLLNVWGRLGFFRFGNPGRRGFGGGLDVPFEASVSRVVFVLLMLVNINFDGLTATARWTRFQNTTLLDGGGDTSIELVKDATLVSLLLVVLAVFGLFALASARAGRRGTRFLPALAGLLPSLVPIAFGYLIAHYASYLLINSQLLFPLLGSPGGWSWWPTLLYPFNDDYEVHVTFLPAAFYWYVSLAAIVLGHVAAVVLAHRHLGQTARDERQARRSEYPWLVAMVAYTVVSLLLIAAGETKDTGAGNGSASPAPVTSTAPGA